MPSHPRIFTAEEYLIPAVATMTEVILEIFAHFMAGRSTVFCVTGSVVVWYVICMFPQISVSHAVV